MGPGSGGGSEVLNPFGDMAKAILLAEDSGDDELLFKRLLTDHKVENPVMVVRDGVEAIAYLEGQGDFADRTQHPLPRIIFLDLKMPRADGFAVLEWLQTQPALKQNILVVVLSQFGDVSQVQRAYALGANSFLNKPLSREDLANLIRHYAPYWTRSDTSPS